MGNGVEMKKFLQEYQFAAGPRDMRNLPEVKSHSKTVTIPLDVLVRFRNDYLLLLSFAAYYCNVEPDKLCQLDLMAPFLRDAISEEI